jgi:hypothetical protein
MARTGTSVRPVSQREIRLSLTGSGCAPPAKAVLNAAALTKAGSVP